MACRGNLISVYELAIQWEVLLVSFGVPPASSGTCLSGWDLPQSHVPLRFYKVTYSHCSTDARAWHKWKSGTSHLTYPVGKASCKGWYWIEGREISLDLQGRSFDFMLRNRYVTRRDRAHSLSIHKCLIFVSLLNQCLVSTLYEAKV